MLRAPFVWQLNALDLSGPKTGRLSRKDQNIYIVIRGMRMPSAIAQMWCEKCVLESESGKPI